LQRVEHQSGGFVLHLPRTQQLHDLHQRHLHGIRVFEHGYYEFGLLELVGRDALALILTANMEKAQPPAPQRWTPALCAIHFYVLAAGYIIERHILSHRDSDWPQNLRLFPVLLLQNREQGYLNIGENKVVEIFGSKVH
jgi:hypothetical protein